MLILAELLSESLDVRLHNLCLLIFDECEAAAALVKIRCKFSTAQIYSPDRKENEMLEASIQVGGGVQLLHLFEVTMVDDCKHTKHTLEDILDVRLFKVCRERFSLIHGEDGGIINLRFNPG